MTEAVQGDMEAYNLTRAVRILADFIVDDLSNWYVRRSRDRFWGSAESPDARAAFATLHEALVTVARLAAPVMPFLTDWLHRALDGQSVHLAGFPEHQDSVRDEALERGMEAVRMLATLGRAAREEVGIKVRQPLGALYAVVPQGYRVTGSLLEIVRDELNVKSVDFMDQAEELVTFSARPNFKALGVRLGNLTPQVASAIRKLSSERLAAFRCGEPLVVEVKGERVQIGAEDMEIVQIARGDLKVQAEAGFTVALDPTITPALRAEGLARELVNRVQRLRKDAGLEVSDRIRLGIAGDDEIRCASEAHRDFIAGETLARDVMIYTGEIPSNNYEITREVGLDGVRAVVGLARVES